mgnify:CR=1 FL=1
MAKQRNTEVKKHIRRVTDLGRLPASKVTVDDVIATGDINALLVEVQTRRADIDGILLAWRNGAGVISYRYVKCSDGEVITMCEIVKQHLVQKNWLHEDD